MSVPCGLIVRRGALLMANLMSYWCPVELLEHELVLKIDFPPEKACLAYEIG